MAGRFDERCPHCEMKIEHLYDSFIAGDYRIDFSFPCPFCDKEIIVDVHTVPEFELSKPEGE